MEPRLMINDLVSLEGVKAIEQKVGKYLVKTKTAEVVKEELPGFYNDGIGGTKVKRTTEDEIFDYLGRFVGRRVRNEAYLTKVNDNGKIYIPDKPYILSKEVNKEAFDENGKKLSSSTTKFRYQTGTRSSRQTSRSWGTEYFDFNGLPKK